MKVHNHTEDVVADILENLLLERSGICKCMKCRLDITAMALNKLPSKYVVSEKGRLYTKLAELELQLKVDVIKEVTKAIEIIKNNPRH